MAALLVSGGAAGEEETWQCWRAVPKAAEGLTPFIYLTHSDERVYMDDLPGEYFKGSIIQAVPGLSGDSRDLLVQKMEDAITWISFEFGHAWHFYLDTEKDTGMILVTHPIGGFDSGVVNMGGMIVQFKCIETP